LDIVNPNRINNEKAVKLWKMLVLKKYTIMISEDMLSTIFYINKDKKQTLHFFEVIAKRWKIVSFGKDVIKYAIDLSLEHNLDLEDLLQCLCAKENGCEILITNDKKFYDCGVSIYTTEKFLNK
jgi:predicted nucleic acid-binding protein